jgi:NADPH:quinone reductase-like Zn-dependent oxidoreductase
VSVLRELWFTGRHAVELRQGAPAALQEGQVRARALASGISQGTELLLFGGEGPTPFDPSLDAPDAPTYPRRYGYAWVGQVVDSRAAALAPGARVFGLLPHGDEHCVSTGALRALPSSVPAERAVLAANLETAVNVVWDGGIALGDDVLVIGGGVVGLLCGFLARLSGAATVRLLEPAQRRCEAALKLGFDAAVAPSDGAPVVPADVVIEASGRPECLSGAIAHARQEGVVVVASFYGQRVAPLELGADFHRRRLTLRSSQVSHLPPHRSARWSYARRFELVCRLLADTRLDLLLERPVAFDEAPALYGRLAHSSADLLQCSFHYR